MSTFRTSRPLRFGDCDPSGIAYFPSYLDILVGVVEELFERAGNSWPEMVASRRIGTPTVRLDLTFAKPGFHGDRLDFTVRVKRLGRSSMDLDHAVSANGELLWSARQTLVATSLDTHRSCPWPDDFRAAFAPYLENDDDDT